jgi:hypothetical protein
MESQAMYLLEFWLCGRHLVVIVRGGPSWAIVGDGLDASGCAMHWRG